MITFTTADAPSADRISEAAPKPIPAKQSAPSRKAAKSDGHSEGRCQP